MYNVEKYIGALLESLLAQTFQDFEVVVVDNGSTDKSPAILESYVEKFGGRLKTSRIEINSGSPSPAYNKAVALSRGKYVYVIDSDDLLVNNALEILYTCAEKFNADVVYTDRGFRFDEDSDKPFPVPENLRLQGWQNQPFVDKPTLITENIGERINQFCNYQMGWPAWEKMARRDFLIDNNIVFPIVNSSADILWTIQAICLAKNFLQIPNPLYIHRNNSNSITRKKKTPSEEINFWTEINIYGLKFLTDWFNKQKFFQENPLYKFALLEMFKNIHVGTPANALKNLPPYEGYEILKPKFIEKFSENGDLLAYIFTSANLSHLKEKILTQRIIELENKLKQLQGG